MKSKTHEEGMTKVTTCPLCKPDDSRNVIWHNDHLRVIHVPDGGYPGYTRVIWNRHVTEMTDLKPAQRSYLMEAVWVVESVMRDKLAPHKVNLAQFGNQVPHLHWHVIPRWTHDPLFPDAVWAAPKEQSPEQRLAWEKFLNQQESALTVYHAALRDALATLPTLQDSPTSKQT